MLRGPAGSPVLLEAGGSCETRWRSNSHNSSFAPFCDARRVTKGKVKTKQIHTFLKGALIPSVLLKKASFAFLGKMVFYGLHGLYKIPAGAGGKRVETVHVLKKLPGIIFHHFEDM